ncbi:PD40 domain-containing protein, partial [Gemmatimonas aurantiaca]|nr:PD40 domain-containing protein [Gemmatimonas aurantiaca]
MRQTILKLSALVALALGAVFFLPLFPTNSLLAQETAFGKNKVVYRDFTWQFIQSHHFDVYYYDDQYNLAKFAAENLEEAYQKISSELDYSLRSRIPVFVYLSPNDLQTTNITSGNLPEGVNGFTEVFKKRVVVHFNGSYADFRHLLHHELAHAVSFDLLFGNSLSSLISRGRFFNMPLWFAEGYAEYTSRGHWFYQSDMITRDATINNYLRPPGFMGILAYTVGAGLVGYIVDNYGEEKLGQILRKGKVHLSMDKAIKSSLGISMKKLWENYTLSLKQRYWPEIAQRKGPGKIAKQLTFHGKDGSFFNEKPMYSPKGGEIAIFSDRSDYTEIFLISDIDGKVITKLTKASRSGDLESLHSYFSGITFSPDGDSICFVAKSEGSDALFFMDVQSKKTYHKKRVSAYGILSPVWSPDGEKVVYSALMNGRRDLFVYDLRLDQLIRLTDDLHDDRDASWLSDGSGLVFSSDRPHPENNVERDVTLDTTGAFIGEDGSALAYGAYNLFTLIFESETGDKTITPLPVGEGNNKSPAVSPDGKKICFVSNRNGIDNLYLHFMDSTGAIAITDLLTGVGSPSWAPSGKEIAFSSFNVGGFDVFILKDVLPAGIAGELTLTGYYSGKYDPNKRMPAYAGMEIDTTAYIWSPATLGWVSDDSDSTGGGMSAVQSLLAGSFDSSEVIVATESGVTEDGDFVFVSDDGAKNADGESDDSDKASGDESVGSNDDIFADDSSGPIDAILTEVPDADLSGRRGPRGAPPIEKPEDNMDESGEYRVKPYKTKFTTDLVSFGGSFDTFLGTRAQVFMAFSDYLGEQQIFITSNANGSLDQINLQVWYFNSSRRTRLGVGAFHTKNFYSNIIGYSRDGRIADSLRTVFFSDRFYGVSGFASRPFSLFSRIEASASFIIIDRDYIFNTDPRLPHS